jgi:hypothetical protein
MPDPIDVEQLRRDNEQIDRRDFPDGTVLGDLRDYGDLGGQR